MNTKWKYIEGYEGLYEISDKGAVKSLRRRVMGRKGELKEKELKHFKNHRGYRIATLSKNGRNKKFQIHRLVAIAFINNIERKPEVNHIDGNKDNNDVSNLEWVTQQENFEHAVKHLGFNQQGENHAQAKLKESEVLRMKSLFKTGKYRYADLGRIFKVDDTHASKIINGKVWAHLK